MKKLLILLVILNIGCNSIKNHKTKEVNTAKSEYKTKVDYSINSEIVTKAIATKIDKYTEKIEESIKQSEDNISVTEGEITKQDKNGNITTIKGKGINTNQSSYEHNYKQEIEKVNQLYEEKYDKAIKKIDSTYEAQYQAYQNNITTEKDKQANRFSWVIGGIIVLGFLVFAILKRHKLI